MYCYDSRKINQGDTFLCLPGGEAYILDAKKRGADEIKYLNRREFAHFSAKHFKHIDKKLCIIGITGTNGKSSVAFFVHHALQKLGFKSLMIGTLTHSLTTPESWDLFSLMSEHARKGGSHVVMEVSSHAIHQHRILSVDFTIKCLTNITRDHLDYHGSFQHYKNTKLNFMSSTYPGISLYPESYLSQALPFDSPLKGRFNHENLKAAYAILKACQISEQGSQDALKQSQTVPGRFEEVKTKYSFSIFIDYAHTPDALENILKEACKIKKKSNSRLFLVFGCGGQRDISKRPVMGRIASLYADFITLCNDNPRHECPKKIIAEILKGVTHEHVTVIYDRFSALIYTLSKLKAHDILIIAGKGHEKTQQLGYQRLPFSDHDACQKIINKWEAF